MTVVELTYPMYQEQVTYMGNPPRSKKNPYFETHNLEQRNYPSYSWNNQRSQYYNQNNYQPDGTSSLEATFEEFNKVYEEIMFDLRMPTLEATLENFMQQIQNLKIQ